METPSEAAKRRAEARLKSNQERRRKYDAPTTGTVAQHTDAANISSGNCQPADEASGISGGSCDSPGGGSAD
jgi:hypothetical protein